MVPCFEILEKAWKKFDVNLIDMKIEIGINQNKEIVIADVIDNDSWRIWPNGDPKQQLDKQSFRDGESLTTVQEKYRIVTEYTKHF
jgi:phosphoribosylaminoimidazole carboxylase/phosphoribosylaminoimidazole-succinocarboxamide synthase